jgi:hypothetical protein
MVIRSSINQRGFGIVESMMAAMILLFVLSTGLILLNSVMFSMALDNKLDEVSTFLDERVNIYRLTGTFDATTKDGIEFKKTVIISEVNDAIPTENTIGTSKHYDLSTRKKMEKKAAAEAEDSDVEITYKIINIAAIDKDSGAIARVKIIEREVESDEIQEQ